MFPQAHAAPAPDDAPSLEDIVNEETQGGSRIVRFLVSAMQADVPDARTHHRVEAARQLVDLSVDLTGAFIDSPIARVVREETQDGRLIVRFLLSVIEGDFEDARLTHRLRASRLYARLNPRAARSLAARALLRSREAVPGTRSGDENPPLAADADEAVELAAQKLAQFILEETDGGRHIVLFLLDVMEGNPAGSKLHHRLAACLELMRRCFDRPAAPRRNANADADHTLCVPAPQPAASQPASHHGTVSASNPWGTPRKPEWRHFEYPEDYSYDFSIYGVEEYRRDRYGHKALMHIFGDDETRSAANLAVLDYKVDQIEAQRAAVHSDNETCQPYDPCPSCLVPDPPDDDFFGQNTYGYNALLYIYGDKASARTGYTAAMDHKERIRLALLAAADTHDTVDHDLDHPTNGPDPSQPPPKPRALAYF